MSQSKNLLNRRTFLKGAAGAGMLSMTGFAGLFSASSVSAAEGGDDVQTILNLAATAETLAVTHYYSIIMSRTFDLADDEIVYLKFALDQEQSHLEFLNANGAKSLTSSFYVPSTLLSDKGVFVQVTDTAETAFVGAYLAATRRFADLGNSRLAATAAQVACIESQHLALVRDIGGLVPNETTLALPVFFNVSNAVPVLAPFLNGGSGFIGPVQYPGKDNVVAALGGIKSRVVAPFTTAY
jgi:hypothetical protein